jgi:steroid delta-isomerase-like uncharacterized protein
MKQLIHTMLKAGSLLLIMLIAVTTGCQQQPDYSKELKPIFDKYYEVWETGNVDDLDAIFDSKFVRHSDASTSVEGLDKLKKLITEFRTAYPDIKVVSNEEIYSENRFAGRWTFTGTNTGPGEMPPTGKSVTVWGINIIHFENGKIVEEWDSFDNVPFMEQLGFIMMPSAAEKK